MKKLNLVLRITETKGDYSHSFGHDINYLLVGGFRGSGIVYYDPGGGLKSGSDNLAAAWMALSMSIQGSRSLTMAMPPNTEMEAYYRKHTELADAIKHLSINVVDPERHVPFVWNPVESISIFDVTVVPSIVTVNKITTVGLLYSGATKIWH